MSSEGCDKGKEEGEFKEYHENEQLWMIYNYVNGKIEGEYKSYYMNGQLYLICNCVNGNKEGEYKEYYDLVNFTQDFKYIINKLCK